MSTILTLLGLAVVVWLLFRMGNRISRQQPHHANQAATRATARPARPADRTPRPAAIVSNEAPHHWAGSGDFEFEVVGESSYQSAIEQLAGQEADTLTARLVPVSSNPYDPLAVEVRIGDQLVGFMSREDARSFRRRLAAKRLGTSITTCAATITGGYSLRDGTRAKRGVQLDMKPFDN